MFYNVGARRVAWHVFLKHFANDNFFEDITRCEILVKNVYHVSINNSLFDTSDRVSNICACLKGFVGNDCAVGFKNQMREIVIFF